MSGLLDVLAAHQRLCILRLLSAASAWRLNDSLLRGGLENFGLGATRDQLNTHLAWLEEQRLLTLDMPVANVTVATLTERGLDVAEGRAAQPGVQRPSPGTVARAALRTAAGLTPEE